MTGKMLAFALALTWPAAAALADSHGGLVGDPANGKKTFRKCQACHAIGEGAENKVGPVLNGVVGRKIASIADFKYSDALKDLAADKGTWTPEGLAAFLEKPRDYVKGTKMSFAGLRRPEERADVIAYLATFNTEGGS